MTIINLIATPDRAYIATDTASYVDETVIGEANKVMTMPHHRMMVTATGLERFRVLLPHAMTSLGVCSVEDLSDQIHVACGVAWKMVERIFGRDIGEPSYQVFVLGWSDRHQTMAYFGAERLPGAEFSRCDLIPITAPMLMPVPHPGMTNAESYFEGVNLDPETFNLGTDLFVLMEAQRRYFHDERLPYETYRGGNLIGMDPQGRTESFTWRDPREKQLAEEAA